MADPAPELWTGQDEFLNSWFPDLDSRSYIIPATHFRHIRADTADTGTASGDGTRPEEKDFRLPLAQRIVDDTHQAIHALWTRLTNLAALRSLTVMMTQASFSIYSSLFKAVSASANSSKVSDLLIVSKQYGVLLGEAVNVPVSSFTQRQLAESVTYLTEAARIVQQVVRTVPGADNVAVRTTLVLSNITRAQLEGQLQAVQGVPCLCQDEMVSDEGLQHWWHACWSAGQRVVMDSDVYRCLVARFVIPATRVEIYLTTQPRLQLKHEHDVVNAVGDVHGAEVFQAGLHQLSLFPTQAELLNFVDETADDFRVLWGPPGTGKTTLLVLRALQWVKHFGARHIFLLQTKKDGIAASCLVEYQLQQTLSAQQQRARQSGTDTQSAQCTFTYVDMSRLWGLESSKVTAKHAVVLKEGGKEKLYTALGLQQRGQSHAAIHVVADVADAHAVGHVYQWLKDEGVSTVRLWAAGSQTLLTYLDIPAALPRALSSLTHALRCPGPVAQEVMTADPIATWGTVPRYDAGWQRVAGPPVLQLLHGRFGPEAHPTRYPWRCSLCAASIVAQLKSLHVGEGDEKGQLGLSANDVFILARRVLDCSKPADHDYSPAPLIHVLHDNGYHVRTLSFRSSRDEVMAVVKRDAKAPAITVTHQKYVMGLERKVAVCFEGSGRLPAADTTGRLEAFSRTTSVLIYISSQWG